MNKIFANVRSVAGVIFALSAGSAAARDLLWTGSANANWNTTDKNWVVGGDEGKTPVAFADGDSVTFDDTAARAECAINANVKPSRITFSHANDFTLSSSNGKLIQDGSGPTDKYGAGSLFLSNNVSYSTSDVHIWQGTVKNLNPNMNYSFGGRRKIYVHDGGKLWFYERNCGGDVTKGFADVVVYTNGVFDINKGHSGVVPVHSLTLDGGTLAYGVGADANFGSLKVESKFAVRGTEPYVISHYGAYSNNYITIGYEADTVFDVADITGDDAPDLTLGLPLFKPSYDKWQYPYGCREIVKTGAGKMVIDARLVNYGTTNNAPGGTYRVREGELVFNRTSSLSWGHDSPVIVNTNATLRFSSRNVMTGELTIRPRREIRVDHGTFVIEDTTWASGAGHHPLGALTLDHANFVYTNAIALGSVSGSLGMLTLGGKLTVIDDKPLELFSSRMRDPTRCGVHLCDEPQEIWVSRTKSEDAAYDLCIDLPLLDRATAIEGSNAKVKTSLPSGFIKTGPGTLELRHMANEFSGNTEIREGLVRLDRPDYSAKTFGGGNKTYLGNMCTEGRRVVVSTNGTLHIAQRNIFSSMSIDGNPAMKAELVVRGGTLVCSNSNAAVGSGIGNLTFDDAKFLYHKGNNRWGFWQINGTFRLTGTKPYDFRLSGDSALDSTQCFCLVPNTVTTIEVDDITRDGAVDVSMELGLTLPDDASRTNRVYGFTKSGSGTLRMAQRFDAGSALISGTNRVAGGTLQVDSVYCLSRSKLTLVEAGAYLSGTGKVTNVEIAEGGGFTAVAGRPGVLTVTGDLKLPEAGQVDFHMPDGVDPLTAKVALATVNGRIDGPADFSKWTITVNGKVPQDDYRIHLVGKTLKAGAERGLMFIIR